MAESPTPFAEIDLGPSKLDQFLDAHQKKLIIAAILIAIGVIAYVIYAGIAKGEAEDAGAALLTAEKVEDYQAVVNQWPTSNAAATALPLMAEVQGAESPEDAIATLRSFLDSTPSHPIAATAKVSLALRLIEQGNTDEASTLLTEIAESESETDSYIAPLACITLGDIAKKSGDTASAKSWYEKAKEDPTEQGNTFSNTAEARLALVNAQPPTKIKPAPKAPPVPPVPAPGLPTPGAPAPVTPAPPAPVVPTPPAQVTPPAAPAPATPTAPSPAPKNEPAEKKAESEAPAAP